MCEARIDTDVESFATSGDSGREASRPRNHKTDVSSLSLLTGLLIFFGISPCPNYSFLEPYPPQGPMLERGKYGLVEAKIY